jgi:CRP/FNR family cyclic AMP-dependent transcriptional regulator
MPSILDHCTRIGSERLRPGTVMLAKGQKTDRIYVLIEGEIDVSRGDICITSIKEPGSIFGEMSLFMDGPPTFTVTARSAVHVHVLGDARRFFRSEPEAAFLLARLLAHRLNAATGYFVDLKQGPRSAPRRKILRDIPQLTDQPP